MTDQEVTVRVVRALCTAVACCIVGATACVQSANVYHDKSTIAIAQIQATNNGRAAMEAQAIANKAAADRAMFESMSKGK